MNKKIIFGCFFTVFLIFMIPLDSAIEAKTKGNSFDSNNQNKINRELFKNLYQETYKQVIRKDCKCSCFDTDHPLYCSILFLMIIILAIIPFIGWIVLIELDLGRIFEENCL